MSRHVLKPSLWRFNRRSVPRGAAVGAVCTVLFPGGHMPAAALLSVPARANVPLAVAITLPGTAVFLALVPLAKMLGIWVLRIDREVPGAPIATNVHAHHGLLGWLAHFGLATIVGLLLLAPILGVAGYIVASLLWRLRTVRKWRNRPKQKHN
ncbi:DUF2062 domain-containing protein [Sphingomonas bacterium]|uniref:DUF2062 domain-containing protein n=1 Tax=Sphingomonas bacterium TaxID=1895847 RepID=UPI0020C74530|nr:DUF2062 domain-containing protein [Sphingomonas bacterium]